jgi:hypothetical protein
MAVPRIQHQALRGRTPSIAEVAEFLVGVLGPRLTALTVGVTDAGDVVNWARGTSRPSALGERRLRAAFEVAELLMPVESPTAIRAWFLGMNPELGDRAPALVLADEPELVTQAARNFVATG